MAQVQKAKLVWAARVLGMNNRLFTRQPRAPDTALACPTNGGMLRFSALLYVGGSPGGALADALRHRVPVVDFAVLRMHHDVLHPGLGIGRDPLLHHADILAVPMRAHRAREFPPG